MSEYCAQCLTKIRADGRDTPWGEILCGPCYIALWGPQAEGTLPAAREAFRTSSRPQQGGLGYGRLD